MSKLSLYKFIWQISSVIIFLSCKKEGSINCIHSIGEIIRQERPIKSFNIIKTFDNINLTIINDSSFTLIIEAGKNLIPHIKTEISDKILTISNDNKCHWLRSYSKPINIYVSQKSLKEIFNFSQGTIKSDNIICDTLTIHQYGNNNMDLNVTTKLIYLDLNSLGNLKITGTTDAVVGQNHYCPNKIKFA